jgi:diguanylate cyclase (GGDEF)-like protein/PAS domain S-box-containing protein
MSGPPAPAPDRFQLLQAASPDVLLTVSPEGKVTSLNAAFHRFTGWPVAEYLGERFISLVHSDDRAQATDQLQRAAQGQVSPTGDLRFETMAGEWVIGSFVAVPVVANGQVQEVLGLLRDVTELRRLEALERASARTDKLTGLANRRGGEEAMTREMARAARENASVSLVLFDVDHFKKVNDTYGHEAGDTVLKAVAGVLREAVRASDLAVRWGGEELLAILPRADLQGARQFAERVRAAVAALTGLPCPVTISAGVAEWARGLEVAPVLARADARLYEAKHAGRNQVR